MLRMPSTGRARVRTGGRAGQSPLGRLATMREGSEPGEEVLDGIHGGLGGGVEYVVVVGVIDLNQGTVRDGLLHPVGLLRGKDKAFFGPGQADGREQYEGRAFDAGPELREREAAHPLAVVPDGLEVGVVAPPAARGPDVAREVAFEVLVPAILEGGEALDVLDVGLPGGIRSLEAFVNRFEESVISSVTSAPPSTRTRPETLSGCWAARLTPIMAPSEWPTKAT